MYKRNNCSKNGSLALTAIALILIMSITGYVVIKVAVPSILYGPSAIGDFLGECDTAVESPEQFMLDILSKYFDAVTSGI